MLLVPLRRPTRRAMGQFAMAPLRSSGRPRPARAFLAKRIACWGITEVRSGEDVFVVGLLW
jgi:hypothetical protein